MSATPFVITCFARTGSSWLCQLLNSHPSILCHDEVFHEQRIMYADGHADGCGPREAWTVAEREQDPAAFVKHVYSDRRGCEAVGFKLLNWPHRELVFDIAHRPDVHKVILHRRNRVRVFVSLTRARRTGHWRNEDYRGTPVRLDPEELVDFADRYERFYREIRAASAGTPTRVITYERLAEDPQHAATSVEFLGVKPSELPLSARLKRQSDEQIRDVVVNFTELSRRLAGTSLQADLYE